MEDLTGKELGQYRVVDAFGEGGMAAVYKAYQPAMDRNVALKILPRHFASDPGFLTRFQREARIIANLQHPHILPVFDYGEQDGYTFIVMPFVETGTLTDELERGPLSLPRAEQVVRQLCSALAYAHQRGVVHRDLKPSNVLIDEGGNCFLTDFGIAKMVEATVQITQTGAIIGTPAYMSPEQIRGDDLDGRSDLYSLGIVLYEMLTGRPPYQAETPPAIFVKHLNDPLPMPRQFKPDLPERVQEVLLKALAKDREDRFADAEEFTSAFESAVRAQEQEGRGQEAPTLPPDLQYGATEVEVSGEVAAPAEEVGSGVERQRSERGGWSWVWLAAGVLAFGGLVLIVAGAAWLLPQLRNLQSPTPIAVVAPSATSEVREEPSSTVAVTEEPASTATPGPGDTIVSPVDEMTLVYVPGGVFRMGASAADPDAGRAEQPEHSVAVDPFWIDQSEVTNSMYRRCVRDGACASPLRRIEFDDPRFESRPVAWVDWEMAQAYCQWAGRRLPSEAEWEKAARGLEGNRFPWGQAPPDGHLVNFADDTLEEDWADETVDDGFEYSSPVGSYPAGASPFGAFDMAGNVWEWTADWYDPGWYLDRSGEDPQGPPSSPTGSRSVRGGSFLSVASNVRTTYRYGYGPDTNAADLGFRCAAGAAP